MLARDIHKSYGGKEILCGVSLHIGHNQKVALVGSNGVGKSTLLKILAGLDNPDAEEIQLSRRNLSTSAATSKNVFGSGINSLCSGRKGLKRLKLHGMSNFSQYSTTS